MPHTRKAPVPRTSQANLRKLPSIQTKERKEKGRKVGEKDPKVDIRVGRVDGAGVATLVGIITEIGNN